jgi:hypothetical protein
MEDLDEFQKKDLRMMRVTRMAMNLLIRLIVLLGSDRNFIRSRAALDLRVLRSLSPMMWQRERDGGGIRGRGEEVEREQCRVDRCVAVLCSVLIVGTIRLIGINIKPGSSLVSPTKR